MKIFITAVLLLAAGPQLLQAQRQLNFRTSFLSESYSFTPDSGQTGLAISDIAQFTVPFVADLNLGRFGSLTVSSGYTSVNLTSSNKTQLADQQISGVLDTEARLAVDVLPGRLVALLTATLPTGMKTIQFEELAIVGAVSSDLIGFSAPTLGSGGNAGGGVAGALPMGKFALGFAATFTQQFGFSPLLNDTTLLVPGAEGRVRFGFEGPVLRRTYVRAATIFARRDKDRLNGQAQNGVGNRVIGYVSVNQGIGSSSLTLYFFDVFRGTPQLEATVTGAAVMPRGNLFATGVRWAFTASPKIEVIPRAEIRISDAAPTVGTNAMQRLGTSTRAGVDVKVRLNRRFALVVQGGGIMGSVYQATQRVPISGFRGGLHLEVTP